MDQAEASVTGGDAACSRGLGEGARTAKQHQAQGDNQT
jgi:hypothetical protein